MEENKIGFATEFSTRSVLIENLWVTTIKVTQKKLLEGNKDWLIKEIVVSSTDDDYNKSVASCNFTVTQYLKSVDYDLFSEKNNEKMKVTKTDD